MKESCGDYLMLYRISVKDALIVGKRVSIVLVAKKYFIVTNSV